MRRTKKEMISGRKKKKMAVANLKASTMVEQNKGEKTEIIKPKIVRIIKPKSSGVKRKQQSFNIIFSIHKTRMGG